MDHLGAMRAFVSVAKLGSFAEAARRLQLSPSVVTRSVAQLEDQLGLTLLLRTTRSLRLTERGELYLESCEQILQDVDSAERQVRGEDAEPRGTLKVAAPIVFGRLHVLPIVNRVLRDYRDVAVELTLSDRNAHLVEEGVDVAVRIGELADSSLIAVKLGVVSRVVVASPTYLKERGVPKSPAELAERHHRVRRAHRHRRLAVSRRRKTGAPGAATDGQQRRCIDRSGGSGYRDHAHPVLSGPSLRHRRPSHADSATIRARHHCR
jgi:DNA-binding transcriptional LysR family regulator